MSSARVLKAGIPVSLSGQFRVQGEQALAGLQTWAEDVNRSGGIVLGRGGLPWQVSVIYHDDASQTEGARRATQRLIIQDRVELLFGPYSSNLARAAAGVAESAQRLMWNQGGAADDIYQQGYLWVVGVLTPASRYLEGLLPLAREADPDIGTIGIIRAYPGAFPHAVTSEVYQQSKSLGFQVIYLREYPPGLTSFDSVLDEIRGRQPQPQVLVVVGRIADDIKLARELLGSNLRPQIAAVGAAPIKQFRDALGAGVEGFLGPSQWESEADYPNDYGPASGQVLESLGRNFGRGFGSNPDVPIDYPMAQAYAAGLIAQACLEQSETPDDEPLRDAARNLDISTFYGRFKIDPVTGQQVGRSTLIVQWQKGKKVVLWPREQARGRLIFPWRGPG